MGGIVELKKQIPPHPCFHEHARGVYGRVHLPVAPGCNIQCGYCSRACDCPNESRPGVTSSVMEPDEAAAYLRKTLRLMPFVSVAGIAGPGDAFCDPERTLETLELIRRAHPRLNLCLSTNGLGIGPYIDELIRLRVDFVTITVNAATPETGARIYEYVRGGTLILRGSEGARLLLERQMEAIAALRAGRIAVKVNTVLIPGVNEGEIESIARRVSVLGADLMNVIPVIAVPGTPLYGAPPVSPSVLRKLRRAAEKYIPQMRHCARCRADAAGLLDCGGAPETGLMGVSCR